MRYSKAESLEVDLRNVSRVVAGLFAFLEGLGSDAAKACQYMHSMIKKSNPSTHMLPTQYPVNMSAAVTCFFVNPETFELIIVKLMLKPRPWK